MGIWDTADGVGREIQLKRKEDKIKQEAAEGAKEEAKKEQERHQENKEQGMI